MSSLLLPYDTIIKAHEDAVQVIHEGYAVDIGGVTFLDHISG